MHVCGHVHVVADWIRLLWMNVDVVVRLKMDIIIGNKGLARMVSQALGKRGLRYWGRGFSEKPWVFKAK